MEQAAVAASGVYQGVYSLAAAVFALPGGLLSDSRLGRRGTLAIGFCMQAVGLGALVHTAFCCHYCMPPAAARCRRRRRRSCAA